jgi:4-alpha-glucanotransferase
MILNTRSAGILLHPTSLPSPHGIGDLGEAAERFVDYLHAAKQRFWQVLPLGPTGFGNSPYASTSTFAGNPLLIDLDGMLSICGGDRSVLDAPPRSSDRVDFDAVVAWKLPRLRSIAESFLANAPETIGQQYEQFCVAHQCWLDDYALFAAVKRFFDAKQVDGGVRDSSWNVFWDRDIAHRTPEAVGKWTRLLAQSVEVEKVLQFTFACQWSRLKSYAAARGVRFIGDVPMFVAMDSADVWASPQSYQLDANLKPTAVAGVPPDYFSETGQLWGNPLYDWEAMQQDQFAWWTARMRHAFDQVDVVRLDHFRGLEACWSIPAGDATAVHGRWTPSPGDAVLSAIRSNVTDGQLIAEDLGFITDPVERLRDQHGLPGMRILQFAFDEDEPRSHHFLPHNYNANTVVYTGTHDNETICGWYAGRSESVRRTIGDYLGQSSGSIAWDFIGAAMRSVANTVIIPMQDVLELGNEARLNQPATLGGNWQWRLSPDYAAVAPPQRLAAIVESSKRFDASHSANPAPARPHFLDAVASPRRTKASS